MTTVAESEVMSRGVPDSLLTGVYEGASLRAVAMPLGGVGTGTIALAGDGSLRQWQIHNQVNHLGCVPHSFFGIWCRGHRPPRPSVARLLQVDASQLPIECDPPRTSNDHEIPAAHRDLVHRLPGVQSIRYTGTYPIASLEYADEVMPLQVTLEALNPFIPLDSKNSGIPVIVFQFTVTNPTERTHRATIVGALQNAVGWDGISPITGIACRDYGGNVNTVVRLGGETTILMSNTRLRPDDPGNGTMALSVDQPNSAIATACAAWTDLDAFWADFSADGHLPEIAASAPSATGQTWNGALAVPMRLAPGESRTVRFLLAWHFPNRTVNYSQRPFFGFADERSTFWLGNRYNTWYRSALDVVTDVAARAEELVAATRLARDTFYDSSLPRALIDTVTSQLSIVRSPTCFWTEDGAFYGFEGCNGQSTGGHTEPWGGSCPLNCTHVWNYEMSLARLFPDLERSMRETEWLIQQHPTGYLPHRVLLPTYLPRPWDSKIGGPNNPALDGLLGAILKTYREYLTSGDRAWLETMWSHLKLALDHLWTAHDPERTGIILGEQPNTYDISIYGANTFIGTLYLAALRVMETVAESFGETDLAAECRRVFRLGQAENESLWNGEFYEQRVDLNAWPEQNWATGCHADQLLGQWWATMLGLGDLLDPERLATAASSIFRHNFRQDFRGIEQRPRQFVTDIDQGLLMCSWPRGGRPAVPTLYSDEVWTGIEYEVAALLLQRGAYDQAMAMVNAVRRRYDGRKQSPWNDIECGDHYARAMSSWSLLDSAMGYLFDAARQHLTVAPVVPDGAVHAPFFTRDGWGTARWQRGEHGVQIALTVRYGSLTLASVSTNASGATTASVSIDDGVVDTAGVSPTGNQMAVHFAAPIHLTVGQTLEVRFGEERFRGQGIATPAP